MKTIKLLSIAALSLVSACQSPAISDIATDKVRVQSEGADLVGATAEAARGCAIYKRVPVLLSKRLIRNGSFIEPTEYLFACMDVAVPVSDRPVN